MSADFSLSLLGSADVSSSLQGFVGAFIVCLVLLESDGVCLKLLGSA